MDGGPERGEDAARMGDLSAAINVPITAYTKERGDEAAGHSPPVLRY